MEVSWASKNNKYYGIEPLSAKEVAPEILQKFREFQTMILEAEKKGNVCYRKDGQNTISSFPKEWLTEAELADSNYMTCHRVYFPET
jgi:hypothetical protein